MPAALTLVPMKFSGHTLFRACARICCVVSGPDGLTDNAAGEIDIGVRGDEDGSLAVNTEDAADADGAISPAVSSHSKG